MYDRVIGFMNNSDNSDKRTYHSILERSVPRLSKLGKNCIQFESAFRNYAGEYANDRETKIEIEKGIVCNKQISV